MANEGFIGIGTDEAVFGSTSKLVKERPDNMVSSSEYDDLLHKAIQSYGIRLHIKVPLELKHFSSFWEKEQINEEAKVLKQAIFSEFLMNLSNVEELSEEKVSESCIKFGQEVQRLTNECVTRHREYKAEAEALLERKIEDLCQEFGTSMKGKLMLSPTMSLESIESLLKKGKSLALDSFEFHWHHGSLGFFETQKMKLIRTIEKIEIEVLRKQTKLLERESQMAPVTVNPTENEIKEKEPATVNSSKDARTTEEVTNEEENVPEFDKNVQKANQSDDKQDDDMMKSPMPEIIEVCSDENDTDLIEGNGVIHSPLRIATDIFEEEDEDILEIQPNSLELLGRTYDKPSEKSEMSEKRKKPEVQETLEDEDETTTKRSRLDETSEIKNDEMIKPLIFRLSGDNIMMGTEVDDNFIKVKEETPVIGINGFGSVLIGTAAHELNCEKRWSLMDFVGESTTVKITQTISGKEVVINLEFFLGFILKNMKDYAEKELNRSFTTAIITVPTWFCSLHRIQIQDAGEIAGFTEVKLMNQEAVGAISYASRSIGENGKCEILALAENFGILSTIMYQWNGKVLSMVSDEFKRYEKHVWGNDCDSKARTVRKAFVKKLSASMQRSLQKRNTAIKLLLMTMSESPDWMKTILNVSETLVNSGHADEILVPSSEIFGSFILCEKPLEDIRRMIREYLPTCNLLYRYDERLSPQRYRRYTSKIIPIKTVIPSWIECQMPMKRFSWDDKATIFQKNSFSQKLICLGEQEYKEGWSKASIFNELLLTLEVTEEAIVKLDGVYVRVQTSGDTEKLSEEDFTWMTPNLREPEKEEMKKLVDSLTKT